MNYFSVRELRNNPGKVWESLEKEREAVITNNGKPNFLMIDIRGMDAAEVLASVRQAMAMKAVNNLRIGSMRSTANKLDDEQIEQEIAAYRREKNEK